MLRRKSSAGSDETITNWQEVDSEDFEGAFPNRDGRCDWQRTYSSNGNQSYVWGGAGDRAVSGTQAIWVSGDANVNVAGVQPLPANSPYPANMVTSVVCQVSGVSKVKSILAEFQMWYELADSGDSVSVQFFSGAASPTDMALNYKGGLEWRGSNSGTIRNEWKNYHIVYPSVDEHDDTLWVKWKFVSDGNDGAASGVWLDDLSVSISSFPIIYLPLLAKTLSWFDIFQTQLY